MNHKLTGMDWPTVDAVATVGLGVLFIMWADIIFGLSGSLHFNSILLYLLIGGLFLSVGVGSLVLLHEPYDAPERDQTRLETSAE